MAKLQNTNVSFKVGKKEYSFNVWHNLPENSGLSLSDAVQNWICRTNDYTAKSLCNYIDSKDTGFTCKPA